jgi:hypothetical protein
MYVKIKNGAVDAFPYGIRELMNDNPNTSFPERVDDVFLSQYGIYPVISKEIPQPFDNVMQNAATVDPVFTNGAWVQAWKITPASAEEVAQRLADLAQNVRSTRNQLLAETDWAALTDTVLTPEMAAYRKALRDVTDQDGFPQNVIWPVKP